MKTVKQQAELSRYASAVKVSRSTTGIEQNRAHFANPFDSTFRRPSQGEPVYPFPAVAGDYDETGDDGYLITEWLDKQWARFPRPVQIALTVIFFVGSLILSSWGEGK